LVNWFTHSLLRRSRRMLDFKRSVLDAGRTGREVAGTRTEYSPMAFRSTTAWGMPRVSSATGSGGEGSYLERGAKEGTREGWVEGYGELRLEGMPVVLGDGASFTEEQGKETRKKTR